MGSCAGAAIPEGDAVGEQGEFQVGRTRSHIRKHARSRESVGVPEIRPTLGMGIARKALRVVGKDGAVCEIGDAGNRNC